jgi:hypothetical protein
MTLFLGACIGAPTRPLHAQQADRAATPTAGVAPADLARVSDGIGVGVADGALLGVGPRYKAAFHPHGPSVTTPLGADAPRNLPFTFELESIDVGTRRITLGGAAAPTRDGTRIEYPREGGVIERYELTRDGLEQSFVFTSLPQVDGDLVVRGLVHTELRGPVPGSHPEGLAFRAPASSDALDGGVSIGGVTGIDAGGRRVRGDLRFDGQHLDLVLPREFVAAAKLPLVLDPVIGSLSTIDSGGDFSDPDVSYDAALNGYLVTYERRWSAADSDIYGQRILSSGALAGSTLVFEGSSTVLATNPAVGNVNGSDRWLACWQQSSSIFGPWDIKAVAVDATSGTLSSVLTVTNTPFSRSETNPAVGGEKMAGLAGRDNALIVFEAREPGVLVDYVPIRVAVVNVPVVGTPSVESEVGLGVGKLPAISRSGGAPGHYLVAYSRLIVDEETIYGGVFTHLGGLIGYGPVADVTLLFPSSLHPDNATVDGDGVDFWVAYEARVSSDSSNHDIRARRMHFDAGQSELTVVGPEVIVEAAGSNDDEIEPAIAYTGLKYHIAFLDERNTEFGYELAVRELDPEDCSLCGTDFINVSPIGSMPYSPAIASQWSGIDAPNAVHDQVLVSYESVTFAPPFTGTLLARRFESVGATAASVDLGGGCAGGGTAGTLNPLAPASPDFMFTLSGASPAAALGFVNLNPGPATPFPCGTCVGRLPGTLIQRPIAAGSASAVLPIACSTSIVGTVWDYNWIVALVPTSPCPLFANVANSNVLRLTVGQ